MKKTALVAAALLFIISACSDLTGPKMGTGTSAPADSLSQITNNGNNGNGSSGSSGTNSDSTSSTTPKNTSQSGGIWVTAYLASWNQYAPPGGNWGNLPTDAIDWSAFTQMNYFALKPTSSGTLSPIVAGQNFNPDRVKAIVSAAHQHNKPVLFTIGGWGSHDPFAANITPANRSTFISNIIKVLKQWGFDGVDLDMEPIKSSDVTNYTTFVKDLRSALDQIKTPQLSKPLLCAATKWQPAMYAQLQNQFDQINLMTYDYSGAWQGWVSWYNSPLTNGGDTFPNSTKPLPSADNSVKQFENAGVNASKLGIGIDFYGYVWTGLAQPLQSWITAPIVKDNVPYYTIMKDYYPNAKSHWDSKAKAAYLSIAGLVTKQFISYDNEQSIQSKFDYIRQNGLGGAIIWELGGGYCADQPAGKRDQLLQAVKQAWTGTGSVTTSIETQP
ncbi:MAG TPA: glycoside hydrolase family 18 protein [Balneolales bacterium]|nr:glycoside hydrolase family 18 protein [Balneolales bacterium]